MPFERDVEALGCNEEAVMVGVGYWGLGYQIKSRFCAPSPAVPGTRLLALSTEKVFL